MLFCWSSFDFGCFLCIVGLLFDFADFDFVFGYCLLCLLFCCLVTVLVGCGCPFFNC